ncbi:hypothetical protein [Acetobacter estunensis]|uniref:hypothetical protein n=1 Tax=Acetobacter estunensis TaxID=104097 RepID=UPI001C2CFCBE|nr:hypothetical protein [Acetobacter estunensis]MBV1836808.1 hypothetical protein [Acetobacter estunensis]
MQTTHLNKSHSRTFFHRTIGTQRKMSRIIEKFLFRPLQNLANKSYLGLALIILGGCIVSLVISALLALPWGGLTSASCRWDCVWYDDIVKDGYPKLPHFSDRQHLGRWVGHAGLASWAFFPLFPLLASLVTHITTLSTHASELAVNFSLWPVLILLCYKDISLRGLHVDRLLFALFFLLYPFNIWYSAQYSEAIYGTLLMAAITALRSQNVNLAAFVCFLLALSRPTGFLMAMCLAIWWFLKNRSSNNMPASAPRPFFHLAANPRLSDSLLLIAAGGAGLSCFVLYLFHLMGDGFAFAHIQIGWNRRFRFFPLHIIHALGHKHQFQYGIYALLAFPLLWKMWARKWFLNAALVSATAILACSSGAQSIERFVFGNPLTIEFLACATLGRSRRFIMTTLAIMACLHVLASILWFKESRWLV